MYYIYTYNNNNNIRLSTNTNVDEYLTYRDIKLPVDVRDTNIITYIHIFIVYNYKSMHTYNK